MLGLLVSSGAVRGSEEFTEAVKKQIKRIDKKWNKYLIVPLF
jgi:hypothetical protein